MDYIELNCMLAKNSEISDISEIVIALLSEMGFDSFEEEDDAVKAYTPADNFDVEAMLERIRERPELITSVDSRRIKQENWNQLWESNFPMAEITDRVVVYAPFHTDVPQTEYRICIMPQMSFGTGHHETTSMMLELMLDLDMSGKRVLDMGCGTGILAIFSAMKHAQSVIAIDIDEWAYRNAAENVERNNIGNIEIQQGDSRLLTGRTFDLILANINHNILLADMATYSRCLSAGGLLLVSGFYEPDLTDIGAIAKKNGLIMSKYLEKKGWVAAIFSTF